MGNVVEVRHRTKGWYDEAGGKKQGGDERGATQSGWPALRLHGERMRILKRRGNRVIVTNR